MRTVDPERYAARRAQILGAAAEVFAECGYDATTTAAICRRAGIGSGTLFHYFPDKRSILAGMVADDASATIAALDEVDRADPSVAIDRVLDLLTADLGDPLAPGLMVAMLQLALRDEPFAAQLATIDDHARGVLAALLAEAQAVGAVDGALDCVRAARWVHGAVDAAYLMSGDDGFDATVDRLELRRMIDRYLVRAASSPGRSGCNGAPSTGQ